MNATVMQTVSTQSTAVAGKAVRPAARAAVPRSCRSGVVVQASAEGRRTVLGGFLAGSLALVASQANALDIIDDRKGYKNGFEIIYEARDTDLPQSTRDGLDQARADIAGTKARVAEAEKRIDGKLAEYVDKKYWTLAREELRNQAGSLRFDLNTLTAKLDKASAKSATALKKTFASKVEALDLAIRKKDPTKAAAALKDAQSALDAAIAALA